MLLMERVGNVMSWAVDIEPEAMAQAERTSKMPFVVGALRLMADAHFGLGATVGSVIATDRAIMPAAVGVDIGCGMIAAETSIVQHMLPDAGLDHLMPLIEQRIPAGVGKGRTKDIPGAGRVQMPRGLEEAPAFKYMDQSLRAVSANQLGTLGSGNHFVEVCLDERGRVWVVLHSGSRGVGNKLAQHHIKIAKGLMADYFIKLEDPDLAYLVEGTPQFDAYISDMLWAQDYARANREAMMDFALKSLYEVVYGRDRVEAELTRYPHKRINCHHNFTQREHQMGRNVWITRKGAISAREGQRGVIPGSMGAASYIVSGRGSPQSLMSSSHGAGRRMSRSRARRELTVESLQETMGDRAWNADKAGALLDEHPLAYKDIDQVMEAQADLVQIDHSLHQIFNYKGT